MNKDQRHQALALRRERIVALTKAGCSLPEICDRLGLDRSNEPRWTIGPALREAGISKMPGGSRGSPPVGLDKDSKRFRFQMACFLDRLLKKHDGNYILVAELTGLTQAQQRKAQEAPDYAHDWTLSQLQRTATAMDISFQELIQRANRVDKIGFDNG